MSIDWMFTTMEEVVRQAGDGGAPDEVRAAFGRFLGHLRATAELVERDGMPGGPIDRADGFRNVLYTLRFGLDRVLGEASPCAPAFGQRWPAHLFDWGGGCPDSVYRTATLTGGVTYRISGQIGNAPDITLQFFEGAPGCLTLQPSQFARTASGDSEVFVGGPARDGAWFELPDGVTNVLLREFFADWATAEPSRLEIEALGVAADNWPIMSPDRVAHELDALGEWIHLSAKFWADRLVAGFRGNPNGFTESQGRGAIPALAWGYFEVPPGHAWIMEMPVPDSPYWSVQPGTIWWRTLDYVNRHSSLNNAQAVLDDDGVFRAVFSHEDPGIANWIDLQGICNGAALVRVADAKESFKPIGRVVALEQLDRELPLAARIDPEGRERRIRERRHQMTRLLLP
ncbi:MAG: hypothetical protein JF603_02545 [Acidobacteria bacterium]|nr:hypothetical protein [Acidobacteriota bacterium]